MTLKIREENNAEGRAGKEARGDRPALTSLFLVPLGLCKVLAELLGDLHVAQVAFHSPI